MNKYIIQRIFNEALAVFGGTRKSIPMETIKQFLVKLILVSKHFQMYILPILHYPLVDIKSMHSFDLAAYLIKHGVRIPLSIKSDKFPLDINSPNIPIIAPYVYKYLINQQAITNQNVAVHGHFKNLRKINIEYHHSDWFHESLTHFTKEEEGEPTFARLNKMTITTYFRCLEVYRPIKALYWDNITAFGLYSATLDLDLILEFKNLKTLVFEGNSRLELLLPLVNLHPKIENLSLDVYQPLGKNILSMIEANRSVTSLVIRGQFTSLEGMIKVLNNNKTLRHLDWIDRISSNTGYQDSNETVSLFIENKTLESFRYLGFHFDLLEKWITPSNLKTLKLYKLFDNMFTFHPMLEHFFINYSSNQQLLEKKKHVWIGAQLPHLRRLELNSMGRDSRRIGNFWKDFIPGTLFSFKLDNLSILNVEMSLIEFTFLFNALPELGVSHLSVTNPGITRYELDRQPLITAIKKYVGQLISLNISSFYVDYEYKENDILFAVLESCSSKFNSFIYDQVKILSDQEEKHLLDIITEKFHITNLVLGYNAVMPMALRNKLASKGVMTGKIIK
ncbi:hypothetical protein CYY_003260 [Polysphondylium violaceum]|uniref:Uncharacterized protein n=1 Tax=Polysphondylium violaceum TaxID=133409 RepID=A0A8J4Q715_9MYCE|nr:hypothetical protein CYY_003260 [Polysphondylium violaceum]